MSLYSKSFIEALDLWKTRGTLDNSVVQRVDVSLHYPTLFQRCLHCCTLYTERVCDQSPDVARWKYGSHGFLPFSSQRLTTVCASRVGGG